MENEIIINWVTYVKKEDNQKKQSKRGNGYWFIDTNGNILRERDEYNDKYKPFNYPTEAEAIKVRDKQLALYRIKTYAEDKRGEFIPDWNNLEEEKLYIWYNHRNKEYEINSNYSVVYLRPFYLAEIEHCNEIIEKFKDDLDILFDRKWNQ
jgi:hypothetical protein